MNSSAARILCWLLNINRCLLNGGVGEMLNKKKECVINLLIIKGVFLAYSKELAKSKGFFNSFLFTFLILKKY